MEMSALYAAEGPEMDEVRMFLKKERKRDCLLFSGENVFEEKTFILR